MHSPIIPPWIQFDVLFLLPWRHWRSQGVTRDWSAFKIDVNQKIRKTITNTHFLNSHKTGVFQEMLLGFWIDSRALIRSAKNSLKIPTRINARESIHSSIQRGLNRFQDSILVEYFQEKKCRRHQETWGYWKKEFRSGCWSMR